MREIKFRAWDDTKKEMYNRDFTITYSGEFASTFGLYPSPTVILMQYTGLKDKNDNEIYEGDIVIDAEVPTSFLIPNVWAKGTYKIVYLAPEFCCEEMPVKRHSNILNINDFWDMEIIGNIHENPKLLEG